MIAKVETLDV